MKNSAGFTLIEVMITVAIVGAVFAALGALEIALMRGTGKTSLRFDRLWQMTFFLEQSVHKVQEKNKLTEKIKEPEMTLTFEKKLVDKESPLAKFEDLYSGSVVAQYKNGKRLLSENLVTFKYQKGEDEAGIKPS